MPIQITCTGCQAKLKAPDTAAGKKTKCPKCQTVVSVPAANGSPAGHSTLAAGAVAHSKTKPVQWFLQTPDGSQYGPVPRDELDQWFAEGRVSAECQLLQEGSSQWQWATGVFPALSQLGATASSASQVSLGSGAASTSPLTSLSPAATFSDPLAPSSGTLGLTPLGSTPAASAATLPSFTSGTAPGPLGSPGYASSPLGATNPYSTPASLGSYGGYQQRSGPHAMAIVSGIFSILFGVWNILGGIIGIGLGIVLLVGGGAMAAAAPPDSADAAKMLMFLGGVGGAVAILLGGVALAYGIGQTCTGIGVIRRRQWARIVTFIFCVLCFFNLCIHVLGILTLSPYSFLVFFADIAFITIQMIAMCLPDVTRDFR